LTGAAAHSPLKKSHWLLFRALSTLRRVELAVCVPMAAKLFLFYYSPMVTFCSFFFSCFGFPLMQKEIETWDIPVSMDAW